MILCLLHFLRLSIDAARHGDDREDQDQDKNSSFHYCNLPSVCTVPTNFEDAENSRRIASPRRGCLMRQPFADVYERTLFFDGHARVSLCRVCPSGCPIWGFLRYDRAL